VRRQAASALAVESGASFYPRKSSSPVRAAGTAGQERRAEADESLKDLGISQGEVTGKRILLAVDDCDLSEQALQWVIENLLRPGLDEIRLIHVVAGQRTDAATGKVSSHCSDYLAGSVTGSEEEDVEVVPLPSTALHEWWAEHAHEYLQRRFLGHLEKLENVFEVELIKEYGPKSPAAIGHCLCDAADGLDADLVVVAQGRRGEGRSAEVQSTASFVAHYCHRPVVMLSQSGLESYLERTSATDGRPLEWQAQLQWTSALTRARYPSVTEVGTCWSRALLFAVDTDCEARWAIDWALHTVHRQGDEIHLVHVATDENDQNNGKLHELQIAMAEAGVPTHVHVVVEHEKGVGRAQNRVGGALLRLEKELDARMLFLINHSRANLDDFLWHSITGHCTRHGSCPTVVLHPPHHP